MPERARRSGHGEKRSRKQEMAVLALLTEPTIGKAAERVGISENTLWRWLQEDSFQAIYREAKRQAVGQAIARIQQATTTAVDTLVAVMVNKKAPAMAKVLAAKTVFDVSFKAIETEALEGRIEALERALEEND